MAEISDVPSRRNPMCCGGAFKRRRKTSLAGCEEHFAAEAKVRAETCPEARTLCEQVEALAASTEPGFSRPTPSRFSRANGRKWAPCPRSARSIWIGSPSACDRFSRVDTMISQRASGLGRHSGAKDRSREKAKPWRSRPMDRPHRDSPVFRAEWKKMVQIQEDAIEAIAAVPSGMRTVLFRDTSSGHDVARTGAGRGSSSHRAELEALGECGLPSRRRICPRCVVG